MSGFVINYLIVSLTGPIGSNSYESAHPHQALCLGSQQVNVSISSFEHTLLIANSKKYICDALRRKSKCSSTTVDTLALACCLKLRHRNSRGQTPIIQCDSLHPPITTIHYFHMV
jgi:hypothetical protein